MNSFIEFLNFRGEGFWEFAWPMLWQSSLLILVLFTFDYAFRRMVRASIRHALWLVVLLKLCVPPTLAFPTSPAWWLHQTPPALAAKPQPHYTVTYDNAPLPEMPPASLPVFVPPTPAMTKAAWLLVISAAVSLALLGWMLVRWWQVARLVRGALPAEQLSESLNDALRLAGAPGTVSASFKNVQHGAETVLGVPATRRNSVRLKIVKDRISPAVCGLFRPVILIPQSLADHFSEEQLRAVLLHELIHLRRRDVWVNFAQALIQIFYWWHPLVWLANARIRLAREEAVDDSVMLALHDDAESYAPTLLEVAKLALNRPLASLGLVGIMESRHALRQRIERLMDFHPPRRAGLTLVSLLGILAFTAIAVPMGQAPNSPDESNLHATPASTTSLSWTPTNTPVVLIQAEIYRMRQTDFEKLVSDPAFAGTRQNKVENFKQFERLLESSGFHPISRPRIQTANGLPAQFDVGNETNSIEFECRPVVTNGLIDLASRIKIISTMEDMTTTNQWTNTATLESGGGHVFSIKSPDDSSGTSIVVVTIGAEIVTNELRFHEPSQAVSESSGQLAMTFNLNHPIRHDELQQQLLAAGVRVPPTVYFHNDDGRLLVRGTKEQLALVYQMVRKLNGYSTNESDADTEAFVRQISGTGFEEPPMAPATNLISRHFRVDARLFANALLPTVPDLQTNDVIKMARRFFGELGVNLDVPGKSVFFNDGLSELFVRATPQDMDTIEEAIEAFNPPPPQIHIKARFLEVPKGTLDGLKSVISVTNQLVQTNQLAGLVGILTDDNFRTVLHGLEALPGADSLAEPEVVTTSGRQTQMRATTLIMGEDVVFDVVVNRPVKSPEVGPSLDVVPYVLSDGYTINLTLTPSLTELLVSSNSVPKHLPDFRVRQVGTTLNLWDNQTAIISGLPEKDYANGKEFADKSKASDKELLVFVTATIVDPAGNRIHSDEQMPFAKDGIPPQPK